MQAKYENLQQKQRKTEMELVEARIIATEVEDTDDDDDESSVYKERYLRLKKEMAMSLKKAQQDHQEEIEQYESHARMLEKKV